MLRLAARIEEPMHGFMMVAFVAMISTSAWMSGEAGEGPTELQGTWRLELLDGKRDEKLNAISSMSVHEAKFDQTIAMSHRKGVLKKPDPARHPEWIDFEITDGPGQHKVQKGIYEVRDGKLKLCLAKPGAENRPTEFKLDAEKGHQLLVWGKVMQ
jgi:uncharacterized protein (TIGR03067 family)